MNHSGLLRHKVSLITGGSGDIGRAIAKRLAVEGSNVLITFAGAEDRAERTLEEIKEAGGFAQSFRLDQRDPEDIEKVSAHVQNELGALDILVNNAAWNIGIPFPELHQLTPEIWDRVLETNLRAPFLLSRAAASLLKVGGGHIVNISSAGGITPGSSSIAYSSSKAGLNHLTRCLAVAMAPDVSVNCVAPGLVEDTRMANRLPRAVSEGAKRQAILGKVGQVEDIAEQVLTFVTSSSVTGQTIVIDGGLPAAMR